jgi:hypothetical protein
VNGFIEPKALSQAAEPLYRGRHSRSGKCPSQEQVIGARPAGDARSRLNPNVDVPSFAARPLVASVSGATLRAGNDEEATMTSARANRAAPLPPTTPLHDKGTNTSTATRGGTQPHLRDVGSDRRHRSHDGRLHRRARFRQTYDGVPLTSRGRGDREHRDHRMPTAVAASNVEQRPETVGGGGHSGRPLERDGICRDPQERLASRPWKALCSNPVVHPGNGLVDRQMA